MLAVVEIELHAAEGGRPREAVVKTGVMIGCKMAREGRVTPGSENSGLEIRMRNPVVAGMEGLGGRGRHCGGEAEAERDGGERQSDL